MDPNLFAVLVPLNHNARVSFACPENRYLYRPASFQPVQRSLNRPGTPEPDDDYDDENENDFDKDGNDYDYEFEDRLELYLDPYGGRQTRWRFGYDPRDADIVLGRPGAAGISRQHCSLVIKPDASIWLRQTACHRRTVVSYVRWRRVDDRLAQVRTRDKLTQEVMPQADDEILLQYAPDGDRFWDGVEVAIGGRRRDRVRFAIQFPHHRRDGPRAYVDCLRGHIAATEARRRRMERIEGEARRASMSLERRRSQVRREASPVKAGETKTSESEEKKEKKTSESEENREKKASESEETKEESEEPEQEPVGYVAPVGSGTFADVEALIDLRSASVVACKQFRARGGGGNSNDNAANDRMLTPAEMRPMRAVEREFRLVQQHSHPHVVPVWDFESHPIRYVMPLYPLGSVETMPDLAPEDAVEATRQLLLALRHMHRGGIAHHHLKPANLLVQQRSPLVVAVADFGLARSMARDVRLPGCRTQTYMAPEMYQDGGETINLHADIWSAGMLLLGWVFGLPEWKELPEAEQADYWSQSVLSRVLYLQAVQPKDPVVALLDRMLAVDPADRADAAQCLERGKSLGLWDAIDDDPSVVPLPLPDIEEDDREDDDAEHAVEDDESVATPRTVSTRRSNTGSSRASSWTSLSWEES